jgi:hypothetical protein
LGKPCLITAHHDGFRDHGRNLIDFVSRLNSLRWNLVWRPLGEVVRRSYTIRHLEDGTRAIQMFAGKLVLENPATEACKILVMKQENDPACIESVYVNDTPVAFSVTEGFLRVRGTIPPGEAAVIHIAYRNHMEAIPSRDSYRGRLKVAAKRYISEFRDNYVSRSDFVSQSTARLVQFLK